MRIQVSVSDIQSKRFTKVAKTLRKRWTLESLSLMQAQNLLATLLGYRDLHDLQSNLELTIVAKASDMTRYSRDSVAVSMAWDVSRKHSMPFSTALTLVESLPLKILDFDALTSEARSEAWAVAERKAGRFHIMDEFGYYVGGPKWFEGTPQLLMAGAPSHEFVILPNRQAIRWANIIEKVSRLPKDLPNRLREETKYRAIVSDFDRVTAFYRDEIMPGVPEKASEAIKASRKLAPGFEIKAHGERGLVLFNKAIGGVLPIVYDNRSIKIFEDMATLMTGGTIQPGGDDFILGSMGMWLESPCKHEERVDKDWYMGKFLTSELAWDMPGIDKVIHERGQEYLRCYEWFDEQSLPVIIRDWFDVEPKPLGLSNEVIPNWHAKFQARIDQVLKARTHHAKTNLTDAIGDGRLISLILSYAGDPSQFEAETQERVEKWHPPFPDYEPSDLEVDGEFTHDQETLDRYQQEHDEAVGHYRETGQRIAEALPALASLGELTLGWRYYQHYDCQYDSSDAYMVDYFDGQRRELVRAFLTYLCFHYSAMAHDGSSSNENGKGESAALQITVDLVLQGVCAPADLCKEYLRIGNFMAIARKQELKIQEIQRWRSEMDAQAAIASQGEFLYAVDRVPMAKPEPYLSAIMREGRKYSVRDITVTQDMSQFFDPKADGDGLSKLFALARSVGFSPTQANIDFSTSKALMVIDQGDDS